MYRDSSLKKFREESVFFFLKENLGGNRVYIPVDEFLANTKSTAETPKRQTAVAFQDLAVSEDAHLTDVVPCMWCEQARWKEVCLFKCG